jgi:hypothetical protein
MTGKPQFNFPAFDRAATSLRERGYDVVSPAELDDPEDRERAMASPDGSPVHYDSGHTWGDFLARDVKLLADEGIEAIVCLPGWERSKGGRLETFVGRLCGLEILSYPDLEPMGDERIDVAHASESGRQIIDEALTTVLPPTTEVRVTNEKTGGEKGKKPEAFSLLPWEQLDEVARLYQFGATKYAAHNWTRGYDWSLSFDSLIRHARAFWNGSEIDEETGCSHLASVVFHALALMYFAEYHRDLDDRPPARVPCLT